jgi:uncharacterized membrane protein YsdA (DUF1294 family)/cold shock CspA family protein
MSGQRQRNAAASTPGQVQGPERPGRLLKWNDERGFGFIQPDDGGDTVFVHISGFLPGARRPEEGDVVFFQVEHDRGRIKAVQVRLKALPLPDTTTVAYGVGILWLTVYFLYVFGLVPMSAPMSAYVVMSIITFGFYYVDKKRAEQNRWRITSTSLHVLEALGGWPGALLAMAMLRHLTRKREHLTMLTAIITIHLVFWGFWLLSS